MYRTTLFFYSIPLLFYVLGGGKNKGTHMDAQASM